MHLECRDFLVVTPYQYSGLQILDLEDDIMNLKEDLIQERAEARMEKKRLKKAVVSIAVYLLLLRFCVPRFV
jgi:hypothetical protein